VNTLLRETEPLSRKDGSLLQGDVRVGGVLIPLFEQQPGVASQPWLSDERELSTQFFAEEQKTELSPVQLLPRLLLHGISGSPHEGPVAPPIPDDDLPGSIRALCDHPLEAAIFQGMVFHHQRQPFDFGVERRTLGHRPALQDAIEFQPEIVVQAGSLMLLHDENERVLHTLSTLTCLHCRQQALPE